MIKVNNEIGRLKKVLLYSPGEELLNIVPGKLNELLFDDIPYLKIAKREHEQFADILKDNGVEIVYLDELMASTLDENPDIRDAFIKQFVEEAMVNGIHYKPLIMDYLKENCKDNKMLVRKLIAGMRLNELPKDKANTLKDFVQSYESAMLMNPLVNLFFQRDPMSSIGNGVSIHHMHSSIRQRETIFYDYIFKYNKEYKDTKQYFNRDDNCSIEGGDISILSKKAIAVGISERTSPDAIEKLAMNIFADEKSTIRQVYAFVLPSARAFMHLDTVFTQVDRDCFVVHSSIVEPMKIIRMEKDAKGSIINTMMQKNLNEVLSEILGLRKVRLLSCGGDDVVAAQREQWNDGSNTLAIAPGKIITYERNEITNRYLRSQGIEVLEMNSSELSRGRGGPHCMSMPLIREEVSDE